MGCNCRKILEVKNIMDIGTGNSAKKAESNASVNEKTDRKEKIRILREMWEAAKRKKNESRNTELEEKNVGEK